MYFYYSVWSLINKACLFFFFIIVLSAELWYKLHTDSVSLAYLVLLHPGGEHPPSCLLAHEGWNIALATRRSPHVDGTMACVGLAVLGLACGDILPSFLLPELSLFPSFYGERQLCTHPRGTCRATIKVPVCVTFTAARRTSTGA